MITPQIVVTGCDLYHSELGVKHGDMWHVGDVWIFNAGLNQDWKFDPNDVPTQSMPKRAFVVANGEEVFERQGVIVVPKELVIMTDTAKSHIRTWYPQLAKELGL